MKNITLRAKEKCSNKMDSIEELKAQLVQAQYEKENMRKELEKEKSKNTKEVTLKVSEKGCVQINGIRRFPITFYKKELNQLFSIKSKIDEFIIENDKLLK